MHFARISVKTHFWLSSSLTAVCKSLASSSVQSMVDSMVGFPLKLLSNWILLAAAIPKKITDLCLGENSQNGERPLRKSHFESNPIEIQFYFYQENVPLVMFMNVHKWFWTNENSSRDEPSVRRWIYFISVQTRHIIILEPIKTFRQISSQIVSIIESFFII